MKAILAAAVMGFIATVSGVQRVVDDPGLPELHRIDTATLSPSYGCRSKEDFQKGYQETALFLSKHSDGPDLLFNGACESEDYFEGSTAGDDMSLIADLGRFPLERLSAHLAFNTRNMHAFKLYSKFALEVSVEVNHTYAVLINKSRVRGLFVFTVDEYVPNKSVRIRYAVKEYQLLNVTSQADGFQWEAANRK